MEMYSHCYLSEGEKCTHRAPLGPPEHDTCCGKPQITRLMNQSDYEVGKEKLKKTKKTTKKSNKYSSEFEFADDAISLNGENNKQTHNNQIKRDPYINVKGKEELPCTEEIKYNETPTKTYNKTKEQEIIPETEKINEKLKLFDGNLNKIATKNIYSYCTLPKTKKTCNNQKYVYRYNTPPKRITPDGTHIYYWCDLNKKGPSGNFPLNLIEF